jgi:hypothetical protein
MMWPWDQTSFGKNRDRLLAGDVAARLLAEVLANAKVKRLLSNEHFSVDGTLIEAWASMKSFRPKDGSGNRRRRAGTASATFMARGAATTPTPAPPIPRPDWRARAPAGKPSFASWAMR